MSQLRDVGTRLPTFTPHSQEAERDAGRQDRGPAYLLQGYSPSDWDSFHLTPPPKVVSPPSNTKDEYPNL